MWRYRIVQLCLILFFFVIILRLFYWQVVRAEELSHLGQSQYGQVVTIRPFRGEIKTSDGYSLVTNKLLYLLFANPKEIKEKENISSMFPKLLEVEQSSISAQLHKDLYWVPLKTSVSPEKRDEINNLKLAGIGFEEQPMRFYPEASMAASLIGFVGKDSKGLEKGYFGIEGNYDLLLKGKAGKGIQIKDAFGRPIISKINENLGEIDGRSIILHIDRVIQFMVEKKLKDAVERYQASGGLIAIMNPKTGSLISVASLPSFDPRTFQDYDEGLFKNPLISNLYEPGSTFKAIMMASALDAGVVKPETVCTICSGPVSIGGYEIKTWNNNYYANTTMTEVIQHSDNIGMVYSSQKLGLNRMISYFSKFGIGEITGIDLQGETTGVIKQKDQWYEIDIATASFGQGISITPIQLLSAFSAIANEGKRMEPHVAYKIEDSNGKTIEIKPKVLNTPITSKTARVMTEILVNAVDKGEAKWAKPKGYRIAGKTGTAQIPIEGKYDPEKTIASFIGYAPADDPKFLMLVILDRPTTSIYGSETAAPLFFDIADDLFSYYKILPVE